MTAPIPDIEFPLPPGVDPAAIAGLVITRDGSATALLSDGREIALDFLHVFGIAKELMTRRLVAALMPGGQHGH